MYKEEFELAKKISLDVGSFLTTQLEKKIDSEDGKDIKLELDKKSEELIINEIEKFFDYPILSEECGLTKDLKGDEPFWIVDPIDGSLNFSRDNPTSCISIALWMDKEPIFGVIYDFNRDELFSGYVGVGAWLNEKPIIKQNAKEKSQSILATGFPTYMMDDEKTIRQFITNVQEYKKIRMIGSAALSLAYVASGRFDAYMEEDIKLWDVAAGIAIAHEVGLNIDTVFTEDYCITLLVHNFIQ